MQELRLCALREKSRRRARNITNHRRTRSQQVPVQESFDAQQRVQRIGRMRKAMPLVWIGLVLESLVGAFQRPRSTGAFVAGAVNQNRLPWPGALSTPICPPIASVSERAIASPRPLPPLSRARERSPR